MKFNAVIPFILFLSLIMLLALGLGKEQGHSPSALIGQKAPIQTSKQLLSDGEFSSQQMLGKPWLLNVWASWCQACQKEHQQLLDLAENSNYRIIGLNYKDAPENAKTWLEKHINPYSRVILDTEGVYGIDWGISAVPETFLIDAEGVIQYRHIGPLTPQVIEDIVLPFFMQSLQS